jgi:predicted  nucleic acid-binding Zn-ribbon protein
MAETLSTRVKRLENAMAEVAEKQSQLDDLVKVLLDAQIKTEARFQETGERIDKLVSAIGEFIRRNGKQT